MAFNYSPKIITDSLVLYLDAANTRSYPTTGTIWSDLSRNNNNGTLINGPTFNSSNGGSIVFDGSNDYGVLPNLIPSGASNNSVFITFKSTTTISTRQWLYYSGIEAGFRRYSLEIQDSRFTFSYFESAIKTTILTTNTWYCGCATYNGVSKVLTMYINGTQVSTSTINLNIGVSSNDYFGSFRGTNFFLNGQIAQVSIYNRVLSAQEVLQNYNATKSRFGLT